MQDKLDLIATKARQDRRLKFSSLVHHVNEKNLAICYRELKRNKACGIDNLTVEEYGKNLDERLSKLVESMKTKQYKPQPVKRVYIPKPGKSEKRGLGILAVEEKLVQLMLKKILESIYEADFLDCSYGFRPNRSCHQAVKALDKAVTKNPVNYIVEVDIRKFFDNVQHQWLIKCLEERVSDQNFLWLINRFLKAGVMENGQYSKTILGTAQGSPLSPILANIYLHYILDLWFTKEIKPKTKAYMELIRYCDDFVVCCEYEADANDFLNNLISRLDKFGLSVAEDKTRIIKFGRKAWIQSKEATAGKVESFNFLGFTHYCGKSRKGYFTMGHKTSKENIRRKLKEIGIWLKTIRNQLKLKQWWNKLKVKLKGHYNYFGISGNYRSIRQFGKRVITTAFKWINRRSQRTSMTWAQYNHYLKVNPLPKPKIGYLLYGN